MFRSASLLLTAAFALSSVEATAGNPVGHSCDGCGYSQMRDHAKSLGAGQHYVFNLDGGPILKFEVLFEPEFGPDPWMVWDLPVEDVVQEAYLGLQHVHDTSGGAMALSARVDGSKLGVPGLDSASAYDVMNDANLRGRIGDRLVQGSVPNLNTFVNTLISSGFSIVGMQGDVKIEITVDLPDGSSVVYMVEIGVSSARYLPGRSRTPGGQVIPEENTNEWTGTWYGAGDDLSGLRDHMHLLGASLSGQGSGEIIEIISCTWDGRTLNCTVRYTSF